MYVVKIGSYVEICEKSFVDSNNSGSRMPLDFINFS